MPSPAHGPIESPTEETSVINDTPSTTQVAISSSPIVTAMTERARRRRGTVLNSPVIFAQVPEHVKQIVIDTADALGISQAAAVEAILLGAPLDLDGVPTFVDRTRFARNEELSIPAA